MSDVFDRLSHVLAERRHASPDSSYVAQLHHKGLNKILEKVGEEATEMIIAAKDAEHPLDADRERLQTEVIKETADVWFHSLVALSHLGLGLEDVEAELARRFGVSGLEEKASRTRT